jgi:hypothetical protein
MHHNLFQRHKLYRCHSSIHCDYNLRTRMSVIFASPCFLFVRTVSKISRTILLKKATPKTRFVTLLSHVFVPQVRIFNSVISCKPNALPVSESFDIDCTLLRLLTNSTRCTVQLTHSVTLTQTCNTSTDLQHKHRLATQVQTCNTSTDLQHKYRLVPNTEACS